MPGPIFRVNPQTRLISWKAPRSKITRTRVSSRRHRPAQSKHRRPPPCPTPTATAELVKNMTAYSDAPASSVDALMACTDARGDADPRAVDQDERTLTDQGGSSLSSSPSSRGSSHQQEGASHQAVYPSSNSRSRPMLVPQGAGSRLSTWSSCSRGGRAIVRLVRVSPHGDLLHRPWLPSDRPTPGPPLDQRRRS